MMHTNMGRRWVFFAPLALVGMVLFVFIGGQIILMLWNWLLPGLFGVPQIGFWQALGLLMLCRILFGGFGGRGFHRSSFSRRGIADRVADRVDQRWQGMSPEERERFRQRMRERFGAGPGAGPGGDDANRTI